MYCPTNLTYPGSSNAVGGLDPTGRYDPRLAPWLFDGQLAPQDMEAGRAQIAELLELLRMLLEAGAGDSSTARSPAGGLRGSNAPSSLGASRSSRRAPVARCSRSPAVAAGRRA